jgi:arginine decarboxylase
MVPKYVFFTKGLGIHREKLASFEAALRDAGIEKFNLVRVSSIYPPGCRIIHRNKGLTRLHPGQIVFCVMADTATNEPGRQMAASIGLARPAEGTRYGYLSEHTVSARPARRPATTPKTSPPRCSPPPSAWSSTPSPPGTSARKSTA